MTGEGRVWKRKKRGRNSNAPGKGKDDGSSDGIEGVGKGIDGESCEVQDDGGWQVRGSRSESRIASGQRVGCVTRIDEWLGARSVAWSDTLLAGQGGALLGTLS